MTKEQFLAMSLPYKLKVYVKYNHKPDNLELETMIGIVDDCIVTDMHEEDTASLSISNYGLCLRPLSDLTKEIEHKGEKFMPSFTLFPTDEFEEDLGMPTHSDYAKTFISELESRCLNIFDWLKLIEWHFDLFEGIDSGDAIDVNTLDKNPYA